MDMELTTTVLYDKVSKRKGHWRGPLTTSFLEEGKYKTDADV